MSFKKIMLMTVAMISSCIAQNYINPSKNAKKIKKEVPVETCFRNTLSIGANAGYSFTETFTKDRNIEDVIKNIGLKRVQSNNSSMGLHIDYNHYVTNTVFVGIGYSVSYLPPAKDFKLFSTSMAIYDDGTINYKNKNIVLVQKKNSQYLTLRVGTLLSDNITLDTSVSMAVSEFNVKSALFTYEIINGAIGNEEFRYNFSRLKNEIEGTRSYSRVGVAPGLGMVISLNKNFSFGLNYMCEIYPKNKDGLKPKMISHSFFTKLSYHI